MPTMRTMSTPKNNEADSPFVDRQFVLTHVCHWRWLDRPRFRSMVKGGGQEPRGFPPLPRPVVPWSLGAWGAVEDRLSERFSKLSTQADYVARWRAAVRLIVEFQSVLLFLLPQKIAPSFVNIPVAGRLSDNHLSTAELPKKKEPARGGSAVAPAISIALVADNAAELIAPSSMPREKLFQSGMAPNDNWSHVCARSVFGSSSWCIWSIAFCELCIL